MGGSRKRTSYFQINTTMIHRIYKLTCTETNVSYIGRTKNTLEKRFNQHWKFTKGRKFNKLKLAIADFRDKKFWKMELIEDNIPDTLIEEKEQYYIALYDTYTHGYNSNRGGGGLVKGEYKHPPEMIEHLRAVNKGKRPSDACIEAVKKYAATHVRSPESNQKRSEASKKWAPAHFAARREEHRKFMQGHEYTAKDWMITDPSGKEFVVRNMKKFCRENGLIVCTMYGVDAGRFTDHRGWKCKKLVKGDINADR